MQVLQRIYLGSTIQCQTLAVALRRAGEMAVTLIVLVRTVVDSVAHTVRVQAGAGAQAAVVARAGHVIWGNGLVLPVWAVPLPVAQQEAGDAVAFTAAEEPLSAVIAFFIHYPRHAMAIQKHLQL